MYRDDCMMMIVYSENLIVKELLFFVYEINVRKRIKPSYKMNLILK